MFIEKPISTDTVENALVVGRALYDAKTVVSVGYFLRYLKGSYFTLELLDWKLIFLRYFPSGSKDENDNRRQ